MSSRGKKDISSNKRRSSARGRRRWQSLMIQDEQHDTTSELNNIPNEIQDEEGRQISNNDMIIDAQYEEGSSSLVRRRGPNQGSQIPTNNDERTKINVFMNKFVETEVPREITNDIKGVIKGTWPTWKKVPNDIKDLLWENFKLRYKWDGFTDRDMKKVWNENASERYRATIHLAKKAALSSAQEDLGREPNILDMVGRGPEWMEINIWNDLVKNHWNKEDHKIKCEIARNNKLTTKDGSITKHTGGSISFGAHRERLKKDLGREIDEFEVFERMHKRKQGTGEFVDNKSARVSEQYKERQNIDEHSTHPSFNLESWCDVVGDQCKGRVYGFGRHQHFGRSYNESSKESEKNKELTQEIEDMRAINKRMEEQIIENNKKLELIIMENRQREEKLIEEGRQREENLKEMVCKMIQEAGGVGPRERRHR